MVDLAIASNFARELTEDQFSAARRTQRRHPAAGAASRSTTRTEASSQAAARARSAEPRSTFARLVTRLVQVRG
jgi:hypothetical protein